MRLYNNFTFIVALGVSETERNKNERKCITEIYNHTKMIIKFERTPVEMEFKFNSRRNSRNYMLK